MAVVIGFSMVACSGGGSGSLGGTSINKTYRGVINEDECVPFTRSVNFTHFTYYSDDEIIPFPLEAIAPGSVVRVENGTLFLQLEEVKDEYLERFYYLDSDDNYVLTDIRYYILRPDFQTRNGLYSIEWEKGEIVSGGSWDNWDRDIDSDVSLWYVNKDSAVHELKLKKGWNTVISSYNNMGRSRSTSKPDKSFRWVVSEW